MRKLAALMVVIALSACGQSTTANPNDLPTPTPIQVIESTMVNTGDLEPTVPARPSTDPVMPGSYPEPIPQSNFPYPDPQTNDPNTTNPQPNVPLPNGYPAPQPQGHVLVPEQELPIEQAYQVTLDLGQSAQIADLPLSLTFAEVIEDSRCPKDVVCVWEGQVVIALDATQGDLKTSLIMSTSNVQTRDGYAKRLILNEQYQIELLQIDTEKSDTYTAYLAIWDLSK